MANDAARSIGFYDEEAALYDQKRWSTPAGKLVASMQASVVGRLAGPLHGVKVIDVATGTGRFAIQMALQGASVTAVDSSVKMLGVVQKKAHDMGLGDRVRTVKCSAHDLAAIAEKFDLCTCLNALNHIPDQERVFTQFREILTPGGRLLTNYTNLFSLYFPIGAFVNARGTSIHADVYTKWFTLPEIRRLHRENGFSIDTINGSIQVPRSIGNGALLAAFRALSSALETSPLRSVAPLLYVRAKRDRG